MLHPFEVVADPVRRRILEILAVGEHPAGLVAEVITQEFSISRSAVSHQLRTLRECDAVDYTVEWHAPTVRKYRLNPDFLEALDSAVQALFTLRDHRYGHRYDRWTFGPPKPSRVPRTLGQPHRSGRKGRRGRTPPPFPARPYPLSYDDFDE